LFKARLAFYYGGLTPQNIGKQRYSKLQEWHNALGVILAEHQLSHINFISYPHVNKGSQQSIISSIRGAIESRKERKEPTKSTTMKEMYEKMVGALRGK
jgi:hypothetical protein